MVRQWLEAALGLLERLVAACDEATAFPQELLFLLGNIEAALEEINEASPDVPEDLMAKVDVAERLWEANARLAKDHLVGIIDDIPDLSSKGGRARPSARGVAERCQRAIKDISRLLRPLERPQCIPKLSQLSPALLQPQVTVVATLGELLDTLPTQEEEMLPVCPKHLYGDLEEFTEELLVTLHCTDDTWKRQNVTKDGDGGVTSLSQALAAYRSAPQTMQGRVAMAARKWQWSVNELVDRWAQVSRKATELRDTWSKVVTEAMTAQFREQQDEAARDGTSEEHMVELGQALGREEGAEVLARTEAQVRREARVAN
nr:uncharacterized protein LOC106630644 [Zonotrichia albicollis]